MKKDNEGKTEVAVTSQEIESRIQEEFDNKLITCFDSRLVEKHLRKGRLRPRKSIVAKIAAQFSKR